MRSAKTLIRLRGCSRRWSHKSYCKFFFMCSSIIFVTVWIFHTAQKYTVQILTSWTGLSIHVYALKNKIYVHVAFSA